MLRVEKGGEDKETVWRCEFREESQLVCKSSIQILTYHTESHAYAKSC